MPGAAASAASTSRAPAVAALASTPTAAANSSRAGPDAAPASRAISGHAHTPEVTVASPVAVPAQRAVSRLTAVTSRGVDPIHRLFHPRRGRATGTVRGLPDRRTGWCATIDRILCDNNAFPGGHWPHPSIDLSDRSTTDGDGTGGHFKI